jgi:hypothetical protein
MPIISFSVFKDKILDGSKTQTIRKERKYPIKNGDHLYLWWKSRTPQREKLFETTCVSTFKIKLYVDNTDIDVARLFQNGDIIGFPYDDLVVFARRDGFYTPEEMRLWFLKTYGPINGDVFDVIRWYSKLEMVLKNTSQENSEGE